MADRATHPLDSMELSILVTPLTEMSDGSHKEASPRVPVLKDNSFVSEVVEDILTISHAEEVALDKVNSGKCENAGGKRSKSRRNKDEEISTPVINSKKGAKVDSKPSKGMLSRSKIGSAAIKNGDVGSSPSSPGRPSNQHKRIAEAKKSIADGCQKTILDSKHFVKL